MGQFFSWMMRGPFRYGMVPPVVKDDQERRTMMKEAKTRCTLHIPLDVVTGVTSGKKGGCVTVGLHITYINLTYIYTNTHISHTSTHESRVVGRAFFRHHRGGKEREGTLCIQLRRLSVKSVNLNNTTIAGITMEDLETAQDTDIVEEGSAAAEEEEEAPASPGDDGSRPIEDNEEPVDNVVDDEEIEEEDDDDDDDDVTSMANDTVMERIGTTNSARLNILSTMVGGGSLSLPLAFKKSGNTLMGPILLILTACVTEFCFRLLVRSSRTLHPVGTSTTTPGVDSFESIAAVAFGPEFLIFGKVLVVLMCFFGTVGYAVLLRDMLEPITHAVYHKAVPSGPTWQGNSVMLTVVLLVTPLCTLKTLTALQRFGAASMFSVLILGSCVLFRSLQCNLGHFSSDWKDAFRLFPEHWKDVLDVIPIYISCYVCHYNIVTVHNELRRPSEKRVYWWLRSTTWSATLFYMTLGFAGSAYSKCTADGEVQGNILLDFDDSDPLLLVGRMCLAITITLAFPMLTIPARDIVLRSLQERQQRRRRLASQLELSPNSDGDGPGALAEPLLADNPEGAPSTTDASLEGGPLNVSLGKRLGIAMILFWTGAAVACCVASIDIVWDLLGSSLSIILSYLIPCGAYVVIMMKKGAVRGQRFAIFLACLVLAVTVPLMVISTANAVHNTFFEKA